MTSPTSKAERFTEKTLRTQIGNVENGLVAARTVVPMYEKASVGQIGKMVDSGCQLSTIRKIATESFNEAAINKNLSPEKTTEICNKLRQAVVVKETGTFFRFLFYSVARFFRIPTEVDRSRKEIQRLQLHSAVVENPAGALNHLLNPAVTPNIPFSGGYPPFHISEMDQRPEERAHFMIAVVNAVLQKNDLELIRKADKLLEVEAPSLNKVKDQKVLARWNRQKRLLSFLYRSKLTLGQVNQINADKSNEYIVKTIQEKMGELVEDLDNADKSNEYIGKTIQEKMGELVEDLDNDKVSPNVKKVLIYDALEWLEKADPFGGDNQVAFEHCFAIHKYAKGIDEILATDLRVELGKKVQQVIPSLKVRWSRAEVETDKLREALVGIRTDNQPEQVHVQAARDGKIPQVTKQYFTDLPRWNDVIVEGKRLYSKDEVAKRRPENVHLDLEKEFGPHLAAALQPILNQGTLSEHFINLQMPLSSTFLHLEGRAKKSVHVQTVGKNIEMTMSFAWPVFNPRGEGEHPIGYLGTQRKVIIPTKELEQVVPTNDKNQNYVNLIPGAKMVDTVGEFVSGIDVKAELAAMASVDPAGDALRQPRERALPNNFKTFCLLVQKLVIGGNEQPGLARDPQKMFEEIQKLVGVKEAWSMLAFLNADLMRVVPGEGWSISKEGETVVIQAGQKKVTIPMKALQGGLVEIDRSVGLDRLDQVVPGVEVTSRSGEKIKRRESVPGTVNSADQLYNSLQKYEKGKIETARVVDLYNKADAYDIQQIMDRGSQLQTIRKIATASFSEAVRNPKVEKKLHWAGEICSKLQQAVTVKRTSSGFFRSLFYFFADILRLPNEVNRSLVEIQRLTLHEFAVANPEAVLNHFIDPKGFPTIKYSEPLYPPFESSEMTDPTERVNFLVAVVQAALRKNEPGLIAKANRLLELEEASVVKVKDPIALERWTQMKDFVGLLAKEPLTDQLAAALKSIQAFKWGEEWKNILMLNLLEVVPKVAVEDEASREVLGACADICYFAKKKNYPHVTALEDLLIDKASQAILGVRDQLFTEPSSTEYLKELLVGKGINNKPIDRVPLNRLGETPAVINQYHLDLDRTPAISCGGVPIYYIDEKPARRPENLHRDVCDYLGDEALAFAIQPLMNQKLAVEHSFYLQSVLENAHVSLRSMTFEVDVTKGEGNIEVTFNMTWPVRFSGVNHSQDNVGYLGTQRKIVIPEAELRQGLPRTDQVMDETLVPGATITDTVGDFVPISDENAKFVALASVAPDSVLVNKRGGRPLPDEFQTFCLQVKGFTIGGTRQPRMAVNPHVAFKKIQDLVGEKEAWSVLAFLNEELVGTEGVDWSIDKVSDRVVIQAGEKAIEVQLQALGGRLIELDPSLELSKLPEVIPGTIVVASD